MELSMQSPRLDFRPVVVVLAVMMAFGGLAVLAQPHALKHDEAGDIRSCISSSGPIQVFRDKNGQFYLPCKLPDGRVGMQIAVIDRITKKLVEKTSFIKGSGTWQEFLNYMGRLCATKYTGPMP